MRSGENTGDKKLSVEHTSKERTEKSDPIYNIKGDVSQDGRIPAWSLTCLEKMII